jgi:hypothetical protein
VNCQKVQLQVIHKLVAPGEQVVDLAG